MRSGTVSAAAVQQRTGAILSESRQWLQALFDNALDAILLGDDQLHFVEANPAACALLGYSRPELLGLSIQDLTPASHLDRLQEMYLELIAQGSCSGEYVLLRKDGTPVIVEFRAVANIVPGLHLSVAHDITQHKQVEEEVNQQREILQELFDHIPVMIRIYDEAGRVRMVNREWERVLGWTLEEIQSRNLDIFALCYPDPQYRQSVLDFVAAAGEQWADFRPRTRDGRVIDTAFANVRLSDGTTLGFGLDITERKRTERRLQALSWRLLEAQEAERRRIAHELHDEIGQVLTAVKISLQALRRSVAAPLQAQVDHSLDVVEAALHKARSLSMDLRPAVLDDLGLAAALRWYVDRLAQSAGLQVRVTVDLPNGRLPSVVETACFRVAQEALTNTVRHARARQVEVELHRQGTDLVVIIRDDGVGFNVRAAEAQAGRGVSLGLLGMRERAQLAGGDLKIESGPGRGSLIRAWFPLALASSDEAPQARETKA